MIKKTFISLIIIIAIILFSLIYWRSIKPHEYYDFWSRYKIFDNNLSCKLCGLNNKSLFATTSEEIKGSTGTIIINRQNIEVEIAKTETDRVSGLSNRQFLNKQTGMLFVFDKLDYHLFWMKDMLLYLDIIFLDENWQVTQIERNLSPDSFPKTFGSEKKSKYVLEINGGEAEIDGFHVGDEVIFLNQ